jgi:hypothetical protein
MIGVAHDNNPGPISRRTWVSDDYPCVLTMKPPFRSKQEILINAPLRNVWELDMAITRIRSFHPLVFKVDLFV